MVLFSLDRGVANAGAIRWSCSGYTERDRLSTAAAWGSDRGSGHGWLSSPYPVGFGGSPAACDLACNTQSLVVVVPTVPFYFDTCSLGTLA